MVLDCSVAIQLSQRQPEETASLVTTTKWCFSSMLVGLSQQTKAVWMILICYSGVISFQHTVAIYKYVAVLQICIQIVCAVFNKSCLMNTPSSSEQLHWKQPSTLATQ